MKNQKKIDSFLIKNYKKVSTWSIVKNNLGENCIKVQSIDDKFTIELQGIFKYLFPNYCLLVSDFNKNDFMFIVKN